MNRSFSSSGCAGILFVFVGMLLGSGCGSSSHSQFTQPPPPQPPPTTAGTLMQVSSDPFTVGPGQHATEVEPHVLAHGSTLVAAFQTGRVAPGGSTDIGWATSTDGGTTWSHGFLPGLTKGEGTGPYDAVSDPAVAFDAKHGVWLIASLPISTVHTPAVVVNRSTDGLNWSNPVSVDVNSSSSDKNWIVCDNTASSQFFGNCYMEWDDPSAGGEILMSTSSDGGVSWGPALTTASGAGGIGGQPLVQPNGTVIVPIESGTMAAFSSTNGGATWSPLVTIASIQSHLDAGGIRSSPLPSATVDGAGTVWVVWQDCRFRMGCSSNDLVYSTSTDGSTWSAVARVPIDSTSSTVDHFIPGIGIDPTTSGASAHVAIHYYFYTQSNCSVSSCQLYVGYISSANGGSTWNSPATLAGPMSLSWLPNSQNGLMVGDYIATAFTNGVPHSVFAVAAANSGTTFNEAMFTSQGLTVTARGRQLSAAADKPLHQLSDKLENERPEKGVIPPLRKARKSAK